MPVKIAGRLTTGNYTYHNLDSFGEVTENNTTNELKQLSNIHRNIVTDSTLTHEAVSPIFSFSKSELLSKIAATLLTIISIYERFPGT